MIETAAGEVRFRPPVAYQGFEAGRRIVPVRYVLKRKDELGFVVDAYDHSKPLIIDPVLDYSTYLGGTGYDFATGIAVDSGGSAYLTGYTTSTGFPTASAFQTSYGGGACNNDMSPSPCFDAFVAKLNAQGTALVYSTYLGGSGDDRGTGIAVDSAGDAYVTGYTGSADFPVASALQGSIGGGTCGSTANPYPCYDVFVAKLGPSGASLIYSTYLGGSGDDYSAGVAVDSSGSAYLTGFTSGGNFPVTGGALQAAFGGGPYDAFVAKIGSSGSSLAYSTLLGGSGEDRGAAVAVDSSGNAAVTGQANSMNFPVHKAFQSSYAGGSCGCFDAFVTKLNATGSAAVYSTYLGGTGGDYGNAIALDASGAAYVAGWTTSNDFPVTTGAYQKTYAGSDDAFVLKLSPTGNSLVYSTFFGGIDPEAANGIAVDGAGNAYVAGSAYGTGFPASNALQAGGGGFYDAFVAAFDATGSALLYSTRLGGSGDDFGNAIAIGAAGDAYVAGGSFSTDFPTTPGSFETAYTGGAYDAFAAKISPAVAAGVSVIPDPVTFAGQEVGTASSAQNVRLMDAGSAALTVTAVSTSGDFALSGNCGGSVAPGANCTLSVSFKPSAAGPRTGALTLSDNASGSPQVIPLAGTGTSGAASLSAASLSFGSVAVGATSPPQSVTLKNTAATPLAISSILAGGDFSQSNNCGTSVPAGASCTITISFAPAAPGASVGQILLTDSAPASPQAISLSGMGTAPAASLSPSSLGFGSEQAGTTSAPQTVRLANSGNSTLNISGIATSGGFAQTNDCGGSLAAGASCSVSVTFTPAAAGSLSGVLTFTDDAPGSPQTVGLAGTGTAPAVSFSPASLSFGNVSEGTTSPPQGLTLTNTGTAALAISGISVTADFAETSGCGASLAAGSSCTINLTFTPSSLGTETGSLTLGDNAPGSPQAVALSGTGADPAPAVTLTPAALAFGNQAVATASAAQPVTVTNTGTATLNISSIAASGDFSETAGCGAPLEPGQSCVVSVTFKPSAEGTRTGSLTFTDNAANSPETAALSGTGVAAFTLSAQSNSATIIRGTSQASFVISASSSSGFAGAIALACVGNGALSCAFSPASLTAGGTSTLVVSNLAAMTANSVTLSVSGTSGLQSSAITLAVQFSDFSLAASPSSASLAAGQTAAYQLTLTPLNGFDFPVSVVCNGAPAQATCSASPLTVTLDGASTSILTVSVVTAGRTAVFPDARLLGIPPSPRKFDGKRLPGPLLWIWALVALVILGTARLVNSLGKAWARGFLLAVLLGMLLTGCGGGASPVPSPPSGAPAGTFTLTLQASSGSLSHSATVTLVVN